MTSQEMQARFIDILSIIDAQVFEDTIRQLQRVIFTGNHPSFGDIYDKAQLVNIVITSINEEFYKKQSDFKKLLIQLLFDSNIEMDMLGEKILDGNNYSRLLDQQSVIEAGIKDGKIKSFARHYYEHAKLDYLHKVVSEFIRRYEDFQAQGRTITSAFTLTKKKHTKWPEGISFVKQDQIADFYELDGNFGTKKLNCCVGFCMIGKRGEGQECKIAVIGHCSSGLECAIQREKAKLEKENHTELQVCLIGGDISSMYEYLPLLCNNKYPEIKAARLCESDANLSSAFFTRLNDAKDQVEIIYTIYPGYQEIFPSDEDDEDFADDEDDFAESDHPLPEAGDKRKPICELSEYSLFSQKRPRVFLEECRGADTDRHPLVTSPFGFPLARE